MIRPSPPYQLARRHQALMIMLMLALVACGAPSSMPTPAPAGPAPIESLLWATGDLPDELVPDRVRANVPAFFDDLPAPAGAWYRPLLRNDEHSGSVTLITYPTVDARDAAYTAILARMGTHTAVAVGEQAAIYQRYSQAQSAGGTVTELVFVRCRAVVHIRLDLTRLLFMHLANQTDSTVITTYAQRLDRRLQTHPAVCPEQPMSTKPFPTA